MFPVADRGCVRFAGSFKKGAKGIAVVAFIRPDQMGMYIRLRIFITCALSLIKASLRDLVC